MIAPYTFSRFPVVHGSGPMVDNDQRQMEEGRAMFAYWNTPARKWAATDEKISDIQTGSLQKARDRMREYHARVAALKARKVTDTPRIIPFRADCFKRWIDRLTIWYLKRQQHKAEDYLFHTGRNHPSFS